MGKETAEEKRLDIESRMRFKLPLFPQRIEKSAEKAERETDKQGKLIMESLGKMIQEANLCKLELPQFIGVASEYFHDTETGRYTEEIIGYLPETMEAVSIKEDTETRTTTVWNSNTLPENIRVSSNFEKLDGDGYVKHGQDIAYELERTILRAIRENKFLKNNL